MNIVQLQPVTVYNCPPSVMSNPIYGPPFQQQQSTAQPQVQEKQSVVYVIQQPQSLFPYNTVYAAPPMIPVGPTGTCAHFSPQQPIGLTLGHPRSPLLNGTTGFIPVDGSPGKKSTVSGVTICRHFLSGRCNRRKCRFSHNEWNSSMLSLPQPITYQSSQGSHIAPSTSQLANQPVPPAVRKQQQSLVGVTNHLNSTPISNPILGSAVTASLSNSSQRGESRSSIGPHMNEESGNSEGDEPNTRANLTVANCRQNLAMLTPPSKAIQPQRVTSNVEHHQPQYVLTAKVPALTLGLGDPTASITGGCNNTRMNRGYHGTQLLCHPTSPEETLWGPVRQD